MVRVTQESHNNVCVFKYNRIGNLEIIFFVLFQEKQLVQLETIYSIIMKDKANQSKPLAVASTCNSCGLNCAP